MSRGGSESGMTLVELLVGLVLLSFLALMLSGSLRFSIRAWERADALSEDLARVQSAQNLIRRYLGSARPNTLQIKAGQAALDQPSQFSGRSETVEFIAPLPAHLGGGGLYRFVLDKSEKTNGDYGLRIRWRPDKTGLEDRLGEGDEEWRETILLSPVEELTFSYFGKLDTKTEADWHEIWETSKATPDMVRLNLVFPDGDRRTWPDLDVELKLTNSARR